MRILSCLILLLLGTNAWAQPSNDECLDAIRIPSTNEYCSGAMAYNNIGAQPDPSTPQAVIDCVNPDFMNGVWFSFIPT